LLRTLTDENFDKVIGESDVPVVVDFWADWCGPCKKVVPALEQLAEEFGDKVQVVKVDVDEAVNTGLVQKIMGLPTIAVFNGGKRVMEMTGANTKENIRKMIETQL